MGCLQGSDSSYSHQWGEVLERRGEKITIQMTEQANLPGKKIKKCSRNKKDCTNYSATCFFGGKQSRSSREKSDEPSTNSVFWGTWVTDASIQWSGPSLVRRPRSQGRDGSETAPGRGTSSTLRTWAQISSNSLEHPFGGRMA